MRGKQNSKFKQFSNFTQTVKTYANCFRPETEEEIQSLFSTLTKQKILARGTGLSYSDCCVNDKGIIIDTSRLNHLLAFNPKTGVLICQGGVTFADLFLVDPQFIPPVIPGTLYATVAGGIANDVHGKNNHQKGNFGQHILWIDLQVNERSYRCSPEEHDDLFYATIGGLGLTGLIKRVAISMQQVSRYVEVSTEKYNNLDRLLTSMQSQGIHYDYQVAWLDLIQGSRGILSLANHCEVDESKTPPKRYLLPKSPFRLIYPWMIKPFNAFYFNKKYTNNILYLGQFNNPLDTISNWNYLYGKKGLLQLQVVFPSTNASATIKLLRAIMQKNQAIPTLAVLKFFTQQGCGLLSFSQPGFTLAVDFFANHQSRTALVAMNNLITELGGKIYLGKDLLMNQQQFQRQYPNYELFIDVLKHYQCIMHSDLSQRLGLNA